MVGSSDHHVQGLGEASAPGAMIGSMKPITVGRIVLSCAGLLRCHVEEKK